MPALINNISTFKKYVRIAYTSTGDNGLPNMERADRKYLVPVLGLTVYNTLLAQVSATVTWSTLLDICRCYVAPMAMLAEMPTRNVTITDSGIKKTTSGDMENIFKWEYLELKNSLADQAAEALDELWQHLLTTTDPNYSWSNPSEASASSIIKTGAEFKTFYPSLHQFSRVFPALLPLQLSVRELFIEDAIGRDFLSELLTTNPETDTVKEAISLLKKATAHLTIMMATEVLPCKLSDKGFTLQLSANNDAADPGELAASADALSALRSSAEKMGTTYLQRLKNFLNENATAEIFSSYYSSSLYVAPGTTVISPNQNRNGIFGF